MIKTIIFDWDGTLHDTAALYHSAFGKAYAWLVEEGLAPDRNFSVAETNRFLGMSIPVMWKNFMPGLEEQKRRYASGLISAEMDRLITKGGAKLYPGTLETLRILKEKGYRLVILSNCRHNYLEEHRRAFHLDCYFDGYYAAQDYGFRPKEDILPYIMEKFPADYLVVGDRDSDQRGAQTHRLLFAACDYGFGQPDELADADYHISAITKLPELIQSLAEHK